MTQASRKVKWCLKKAEKESEERAKYRGLIKKEIDLDEAKKHIIKAEHNLSAIDYFSLGGFSDWSMSAGFYCIYHCFLAIIEKFGYVRNLLWISEHPKILNYPLKEFLYESRNQECTIALVKFLKEQGKIEFDNKFIEALESYDEKERHESNVIEKRENYTYGTTISVDNKEEIENNIQLCKECLDQTKKIVFI